MESQTLTTYRPSWKIYAELGLILLLSISQYLNISILNLGFTGMLVLLVFLMDRIEETTVGLFAALPAFNLLNYQVGNISMYYLIVFVFWFRYFQYRNWTISRYKLLILLGLLILRLVSGEIVETLTWFVLISVLVLTYREPFFDGNMRHIILFTSITFAVTSAMGYFMLRAGTSIYMHGTVWTGDTMSYRFAGVIGDPVFFSQMCALLVAANLALGCQQKGYGWWAWILTGAISVLCLESYAKTGMLLTIMVIMAVVIWILWTRLKSKRTAVFSIFGLILGVVGVIVAVDYLLNNSDSLVVQNYITRLTSDDLLTGRLEIWAHYLELIGSSWKTLILPVPDAQFNTAFYLGHGSFISKTHNLYLETLGMFGILPSMLMFFWITAEVGRCLRSGKSILWLMPVCVLLVSAIFLHGHNEFQYYTLVAIAVSFLRTDVPQLRE